MPNHVHLMIEPRAPMAKITQALKGSTARQANLLLAEQGSIFGKMSHSIIGSEMKPNLRR
jgi:REP element-mobilizing transposase RayT